MAMGPRFPARNSSIRASLGAINLERIGGAKFPFLLNKKGNLAPPINSGFVASKLALRACLGNLGLKWIEVV
jgi:hypothetical protein